MSFQLARLKEQTAPLASGGRVALVALVIWTIPPAAVASLPLRLGRGYRRPSPDRSSRPCARRVASSNGPARPSSQALESAAYPARSRSHTCHGLSWRSVPLSQVSLWREF